MVEGYYDLCIRYLPEDKEAMEKFLLLAKHFGFKGVGITESPNKEYITNTCLYNTFLDIFFGIEIDEENPGKLYSQVSRGSREADYVIVKGGSDKLNRSVVDTPDVNILSLPFGMKEGGLDHVIAKSAANRGIALEFDVGALIRYRGGKRVHVISELKQRLMLARKFNVEMVLTAGARSICDMRSPRELIALASLFGMTKEEAMKSLRDTPASIIKRKKTNEFIEGVELIEEHVYPEKQGESC